MKKYIGGFLLMLSLAPKAQIYRTTSGGGSTTSSLTSAMVNIKDFGAIGDGASHPLSSLYATLAAAQVVYPTAASLTEEIDGLAIQTAIDYVIYGAASGGSYASGKTAISRTVWIPDGVFLCSRTINMGYGDQFTSVNLVGEKQLAYNTNSSSVMRGARVRAQFKDRPLINVQGARADVIEGINFQGQNNSNPGYGATMNTLSAYIDPTLPRSATAALSPYCGIAVDAYGATKPTDTTGGMVAYPDMIFPSGVVNTTQWGKQRSSNVMIKNCRIQNFVIGFCTEPAGGDNNGDFTFLQDCQINSCAYGICITHSQSRLGQALRCQIDQVYWAIDNTTFGSHHGRFINADNCHFSGHGIFNIQNTDYNGPMQVKDCYAENLWMLGFFGIDRSSAAGLSFDNCHFDFNHAGLGSPPPYILEIDSKPGVSFKNCYIVTMPTTIINSAGCSVRFENCKFVNSISLYGNLGMTNTAALNEFLNMTGGIVAVKGHKTMKGCSVSTIDLLGGYSINAQIPDGVGGDNWEAYADIAQLGGPTIALDQPMPKNGYFYSNSMYPSYTHGNINPTTLKIPFTVSFAANSKTTYGVEPGYAMSVWGDGKLYLVTGANTSIASYTDTATLLNGWTMSGGVVNGFSVDTSTANLFPGTNYLYCKFNRNITSNALTATATAASNTLTNIQFQGTNATSVQIDGAINSYYMVYLYVISNASDPGSKTSGMYGPFRVTGVNEASRTITFDRNVPVSGTVHFFNTCSY